jgi:hypothetical protein
MKHKLKKTENYLLVVDDSKIKEVDWCIVNGIIEKCKSKMHSFVLWKADAKKIIYHLPLNNAPILEGVPLLPPLEDEVEGLAEQEFPYIKDSLVQTTRSEQNKHTDTLKWGFKKGYNKAKEKYKYTEEDLKLAMNYGYVQGDTGFQSVANLDDLLDLILRKIKKSSRPTYFECEMWYNEFAGKRTAKTITNSQGQTQLVGTYIYE